MKQQIKVPSAGESVTQATIGQWQKKDGDYIQQNEALVLMETDKASMDLMAEHSGRLHILKQDGEEVGIGEVIGEVDTSVDPPLEKNPPPNQKATEPRDLSPEGLGTTSPFLPSDQQLIEQLLNQKSSVLPAPRPLSPSVRKLVAEQGLNPATLPASGPGGRITKGDMLSFLASSKTGNKVLKNQRGPSSSPFKNKDRGQFKADQRGHKGQTRERMTSIRKRIGERLVASQQSTATLTTFNEVDMLHVMNLRQQYKEMFQKTHQVKLGFMGFFMRAVVYALQSYPKVNAFIEGDEIVYNHDYHIGVAVSTDRGLVVPVIRHADKKSLAELEQEVLFYAEKARDGKISPNDLTGGTFTISNGGVFGSLMSTPVLNPPQSGILGMHRIEQRPVVVEGEIVIRPMMYVALSYDHRMVDGRESVGFLLKIKECVEDPIRLMLTL